MRGHIEHFLSVKNKRKSDSIEASIYPILLNVVLNSAEHGKTSVSSSDIWQAIISTLDGKQDDTNPNVFYPVDIDKLYRPAVTKLICDRFGLEIDHKEKGNNLIFDPNRVLRMGKIYENKGKIKTVPIVDDQ